MKTPAVQRCPETEAEYGNENGMRERDTGTRTGYGMPAGSAVGPGEIDELPDKPGRFGLGMHEHEVARER